MNMRWLMLLVGAVVLIVGVVGLLVPVSVPGPDNQNIGCGNAIAADYTAARQADTSNPVNLPIVDELVPHTDYIAQCQSAVSDRRMWTIPVAVIGVVILTAAFFVGGRAGSVRT